MKCALAPAAHEARRLGLFGGSFDPPHRCHLAVAQRAREAFALDHVLFIPARRPPHKPGRVLAGGWDRVAMCERLLAHEDDAFSVWAGELAREGPSYSVDTIADVARQTDAELAWVLGSDNLPGLPGWSRVEELLARAQPIVHFRRGDELDHDLLKGLSATASERVAAGFLEVDPCDASSTRVREAIARGESAGDALPELVERYVRTRALYVSC